MSEAKGKPREQVTLLDVLIDGFEKNEVVGGWHFRNLPMPDTASGASKFDTLVAEATAWKGPPVRTLEQQLELGARRLVAWEDLEIRVAAEMILVRVRAPNFDAWWHSNGVWDGPGYEEVWLWLQGK